MYRCFTGMLTRFTGMLTLSDLLYNIWHCNTYIYTYA